MWVLRDLSRLLSVLLLISISWAATINSGSGRTEEKSSCPETKGYFRFHPEAVSTAIIAPNNDPSRQNGVPTRKVSLVCGLISSKAYGQGLALSSLGNGVSLSALIIQFKSPSLFALHSCLTV
jgi:hypothetical protein